jgi:hypothetical protein
MSPLVISLIALSVIFGAGAIAALLPGHRLPESTRDVVRLGTGLIATISGLVLGLLIASANSSFEAQSNHVRQISADVILLDTLLSQYGPRAQKARSLLRDTIPPFVERLWRTGGESTGHFKASAASEALYLEIDGLAPQNDTERSIKSRITAVYSDIIQIRLLLLQRSIGGIPMPFVGVLVIWLALIFFSFGLFAEKHYSVLIALFIVAASASGALYLILELTHPFEGLLRIPSEPILNALAPLGN